MQSTQQDLCQIKNIDATQDALGQYLSTVKRTVRLTNDEKVTLLRLIGQPPQSNERNAKQARERIIEDCQPLVIGMAKRYARDCRFLTVMDLVQEGNIGLLDALSHFDATFGLDAFDTWAATWIRGAMRAAYNRDERTIRLPAQKLNDLRKLVAASQRLEADLGRSPTVSELSSDMMLPASKIQEFMVLQAYQSVSLEELVEQTGDLAHLQMLQDRTTNADDTDVQMYVRKLVKSLPQRERNVVEMRYGFADGQSKTLKEVANALGYALSTVEMLDRKARQWLRKALVAARYASPNSSDVA